MLFHFFKCLFLLLALTLIACANLPKETNDNQIKREKYTLTLSEDKKSIFIAGNFETGIYHNLIKLYKPNRSSVKNLIYRSYGGYLNEADRFFNLAKKHNLNTYALRYCQSACATAFLGGINRRASHRTKFGFHKYGTSSTAGLEGGAVFRIRGRQYKDLGKFKKQGVGEKLLKKIFETKNASMWKPGEKQLLEAKVVHEYIPRSQIPSFDTYDKSLYPSS